VRRDDFQPAARGILRVCLLASAARTGAATDEKIGNLYMQNFTAADLVQTTLATLAFALFLLPPGYLLGLASNIFGMRRRSASEQLLFSLVFSIAATPILAVLLTRISSYTVTLTIFLLLALVSVFALVRQLPQASATFSGVRRSTWLLLGMILVWFVVVQFSLADLQIGHRLYLNYVVYDHSLRVPFVEAAARSGVPPRNPFYGLGQSPVLRYFYYWYVVCALPMRLFGLRAKACLDASVFWSGLALAALVPLFLKHFFAETENIRRKSLIGIALLSVTGLDLIAYAIWAWSYRIMPPDVEWWDENQVTSWLGSLVWVPHHVASLTACMAGLLALSSIEVSNIEAEQASLRQTGWAVVLAGLAFASAAGLSVYVTFTFSVFMIAWTVLTLAQKRIRIFLAYLATGAFTVLLSWPYLLDLLSKSANTGTGSAAAGVAGERFAFVAIRDFRPALVFLGNVGVHSTWLLELAKLPILLCIYAIEFGFFALILPLHWRRERQNPGSHSRQRRMAWLMFTVCLLTMSLLKSDTSGANDLGFRGMLVVQFVLLLWAAPVIHDLFFGRNAAAGSEPAAQRIDAPWTNARWLRVALVCTLALGVAATAFQLTWLRAYAPLADNRKLRRSDFTLGSRGFGERTYWLREGFGRLDELTSPSTIVQYNPVRDEVLIEHLYSTRQAVMGDPFCGSAFGGDAGKCRDAFPYFAIVFNNPEAVRNSNLDQLCDDYAVHVLVATDADPVWRDASSWVWTQPLLLANPKMRAVTCGTAPPPVAAH
jgi:hypothetical protein